MADFLRESDPCLIVGGDMVLDYDLSGFVERHRSGGHGFTLLLRDDPRAGVFGTIGVDDDGCLRRIGDRFDLGGATRAGVYAWANVVSARAFDSLPDREVFGHLDDWLAPSLSAGARDIRCEIATPDSCVWEPVGTPAEYLAVNLALPQLSYMDPEARARAAGVRFEGDVVVGAGASIAAGASLSRVVVWDAEQVPSGLTAQDGIFAGGRFHPCPPRSQT